MSKTDKAAQQHVADAAPQSGAGPNGWGYWAFRIARLFVVPYLVVLLLLMWFEERLIFPAYQLRDNDWNPAGLGVEDVRLESTDGVMLHGWYIPCEKPAAVILFTHGNSGNITDRIPKLQMLKAARASVFIFDYRGFGKSTGKPNEAGVLADARAARTWLAKRAGVREQDIVLMGESLGGGVAVDLACDGARGLILESTFTSLPDVAAMKLPWIPAHILMRNRLDSGAKIARYKGPLLQSHGDQDEVIPFSNGEQLFALANQPKEFVRLPGASHNRRDSSVYDQILARWLEKLDETDASVAGQ